MIQAIDHIAIAVKNLDEEIPRYRDILGLTFVGKESVPEQKVNVAFFRCGDVSIELLEPQSAESSISAFLEKRGNGFHHIAFRVDDVRQGIDSLKEAKIALLNDEPRTGAHRSQIAFIHPKSFGNILIEIIEKQGNR